MAKQRRLTIEERLRHIEQGRIVEPWEEFEQPELEAKQEDQATPQAAPKHEAARRRRRTD